MIIEPLTPTPPRNLFDCGDEEVTRFLREKALQDQEKNLSRTMVLINEADDPNLIIGYHTLLMMQVQQDQIPNDKPVIKRPIPVIMLGQLGIDKNFQGLRYGELMLMDAQARVAEISKKIGVRALLLDARNERLALWYQGYDFIRFPGQLRMFKNIAAILKLKLID